MTLHVHLEICWLLSTLIGLVFTQMLQLHDYSQVDSKTQCESGLLQTIDLIGFKAEVTLSKDVEKPPYVGFFIKEESDSKYDGLVSLSLEHDCGTEYIRNNITVKCVQKAEKEYSLAVFTQAVSLYSGASIKGYIDTYKPNVKTILLPKIYKPTDASGNLTINTHKITENLCDVNVTSENLDIQFHCSSFAQPCVAEIYVNGTKVGKAGKNKVALSEKVTNGVLHLKIKYAACSLDGKYNSIECKIDVADIESSEHQGTDTLWILYYIGLPLLALLAVVIIFAICILICLDYLIKIILLHATRNGHLKIISLFKRSKVMHTAATTEGMTVLMIASEFGHTDVVKLLIKHGADVNQKSTTGKTSINFATKNKHHDIVKLLSTEGFTALMKATEIGHTEIVKLLIEHGADVNQKSLTGKNSIHFATYEGVTALMKASELGHTEIVKLLIEHGADVNQMSTGKSSNDFATFEDVTVLMKATEIGHTEIVKLLIEHGADVNQMSSTGKTSNDFATSEIVTALMKASELGRIEIVKLLIEHGADVNQKSSIGKTAIDFARTNKHHDIVKLLQSKTDP